LGIWALVLLNRRDIRTAFVTTAPPITAPISLKTPLRAAAIHALLLALFFGFFLTVVPYRYNELQRARMSIPDVTEITSSLGMFLEHAAVLLVPFAMTGAAAMAFFTYIIGGRLLLRIWSVVLLIVLAIPTVFAIVTLMLPSFGPHYDRVDLWSFLSNNPNIPHPTEVVLSNEGNLQDAFLNLSTGERLSAPLSLVNSMRAAGALGDGRPMITGTPLKWMRDNHVDVFKRRGEPGLILIDGLGQGISLDLMTPEKLRSNDLQLDAMLRRHTQINGTNPVLWAFARPDESRCFIARTTDGRLILFEALYEDAESTFVRLRYAVVREDAPPPEVPTSAISPGSIQTAPDSLPR